MMRLVIKILYYHGFTVHEKWWKFESLTFSWNYLSQLWVLSWYLLDQFVQHETALMYGQPEKVKILIKHFDFINWWNLTLMKGLISSSSAIVEGTVGCGGEAFLISSHQDILSLICCNDDDIDDDDFMDVFWEIIPDCQVQHVQQSPGSEESIHDHRTPWCRGAVVPGCWS